MPATLLYGAPLAERMKQQLKAELDQLRAQPRVVAVHNIESAAVRVYSNMQKKLCAEYGIPFETEPIDHTWSEAKVAALIDKLNRDKTVTGITVHLPLPEPLNPLQEKILRRLDPSKDIEAVHPYNLGMLAFGEHYPVPCAAKASVELLYSVKPSLKGLDVVVVGRSAMVGKPVALLLLQSKREAPTPTICHTATQDLASHTRRADVLFAAAGKANLIRAEHVREGAIVIDIGTNQVEGKLVGDVAFDEVAKVASVLTPVPGGVAPVTLMVLLKNILECAKRPTL